MRPLSLQFLQLLLHHLPVLEHDLQCFLQFVVLPTLVCKLLLHVVNAAKQSFVVFFQLCAELDLLFEFGVGLVELHFDELHFFLGLVEVPLDAAPVQLVVPRQGRLYGRLAPHNSNYNHHLPLPYY